MTETSPLLTIAPPDCHVFDGPKANLFKSTGLAVAGVEIKIIDDDDNELPRGEVGEVAARGPNVMLGYWRQKELSDKALRNGWMHTGDGGYMNDEGYVYIVDRVKDMIISGGENIYSAEVENAIYQLDGVIECAVIGIPNAEWGEAVHAIVRKDPSSNIVDNDVILHSKKLIAGFKCPKSVTFREDPMPLSGAGKILKTTLREPFWEGHKKQVS
jgi:long-chain acyl-CoA synthetase